MTVSYQAEFLTIAAVHLLAVASPGPDFAIVLRQSVCEGKASGIRTSVGVGLGIFVHVAYSLLGLGLLISHSIIAFNTVKYLGALYLFYIGVMALRAKPVRALPGAESLEKSPKKKNDLMMGFLTNALNPKATLFFLAIFSVTISPETPSWIKLLYGVWMAFATAVWFSMISLFFSRDGVRKAFARLGHWFERCMGVILIGLGIKLALVQVKN